VRRVLGLIAVALLVSSCGESANSQQTIKVGAVFPLTGPQSALAGQERVGVEIARDFVNADGGVNGRRIQLIVKDLNEREQASSEVASLKQAGVVAVVGAYSSELSIPVSEDTQASGLLYWEAGAVADQLTGRGYPLVFRVGASGSNLGNMSSRFTATVLAPRLQKTPGELRMAIVANHDAYPQSVALAVGRQAAAEGIPVVGTFDYDFAKPNWSSVLEQVRAAKPDILVISTYIPDGVAFRRAMLASGLKVDALIGTTMAECVSEFGDLLGADAIGIFAADRPPRFFNSSALNGDGKALYDRFAKAYRERTGGEPTVEALSGFSAAWTLLHYAMPAAARQGHLDSQGIAAAARAIDLPNGTLPNGAGVKFAETSDLMGQNLRAASVVWQWQGVRHHVTVYPAVFATGTPSFIPLPR
jgi:branched-chain amino acid transport system substrate-binding protein